MRAQNPVLRDQVFILPEKLLIRQSGDIRQRAATCVLFMRSHYRAFEYFGPTVTD